MKIAKSGVFLLGFALLSSYSVNSQLNLGSTQDVLQQMTRKNVRASNSVSLVSEDNVSIQIQLSDYYFENGQLSMTGKAQGIEESMMIFKGDKSRLYGYVVFMQDNKAYEYTTAINGDVVVNEVPVEKIIPVCEFQKVGGQTRKPMGYKKMNRKAEDEPHIGGYHSGIDLNKLQSRPGAPKVFYMDITRVMNGDRPKHISEEEMYITWQILAASYSMFDINVTTDQAVYDATPVVNSGQARFFDQDGRSFAPLNSFGTSQYSTMYKLPTGYGYGRIVAHESGHQFGLIHDGGPPGGEYHNGIASFQWVPVMGNIWMGDNWDQALYQWSKGEYSGASNQEDDFQMFQQNMSFRPDDITEDKAIEFSGANGVSASDNYGQIARDTDEDVFTFTIGGSGGIADLKIDRIEHIGGGMLDVDATLEDAAGNIIKHDNADVARYAEINADLEPGNYRLIIKGGAEGTPLNGFTNYSSMGFYGIEGTITGAENNNINNVVTLSGETTFCENEEVTISAHESDTYSYAWYKNDQLLSGENQSSLAVSSAGEYYVKIQEGENTVDSRIILINVIDAPMPPSIDDEIICEPGGEVVLEAIGAGGKLNWYMSEQSSEVIHTGDAYTVDISSTTSFFVSEGGEKPTVKVGPVDNSLGDGGMHRGDNYLVFDADKSLLIKSVKVYADGSGERRFVLRNNADEELASLDVNVPDGESRVALNFEVPAENDLQLGVERINGADAGLYRNNSGVSYPYSIDDLVTIKESSATGSELEYYYYCYDWEVQENGAACESSRTKVTVTVDPCTGVNNSLASWLKVFPNPAQAVFNLEILSNRRIDQVSLALVGGGEVYRSSVFEKTIDVSQFASGIYILRVVSGDDTHVMKISVE